jgi:hypothetical protein
MATTEIKPGERTAKFVHPFTRLNYDLGCGRWETLQAVGMPYEDNGEFWVDAKPLGGSAEDVFPTPLYNAQLGI